MSGPASSRDARRVERGEISWVTVVLLMVVAGGGYLTWVWAPLYLENYAVKQVVQDYINQAIKNRDDAELRRNMVLKIRSLDQVSATDEQGRTVQVPAVPLEENQVTWERDASGAPPTLHVAFEYERQVAYPILGRSGVKTFEVDVTGDLTRADWGPAR